MPSSEKASLSEPLNFVMLAVATETMDDLISQAVFWVGPFNSIWSVLGKDSAS